MYESYGEGLLAEYTYDGKLMAMPGTEVDYGTSMLWLRKDWMDKLGLAEPQTPEEAYEIIRIFAEENPGECAEGNVGLAFTLPGQLQSDPVFSVQPIFNTVNSFRNMEKGRERTVCLWFCDPNTRIINSFRLRSNLQITFYMEGVLDEGFMLRTSNNIINLIDTGACGAVCGLWWLPYGYLQGSRERQGADWQPYVLCDENNFVRTPSSYEHISCVVVRKDMNIRRWFLRF